jgi:hypothetical protein
MYNLQTLTEAEKAAIAVQGPMSKSEMDKLAMPERFRV